MRKPIVTFDMLLELLALMARTLCLLPVWLMLSTIATKAAISPLLYCSVLFFCGVLTAVTVRIGTLYQTTRPLRSKLLRCAVMLAAAFCAIWFCRFRIGIPCALLLTGITILFCAGSAKRDAEQLFDTNAFVGFLTLHTLAAIMLHSIELSPPLYFMISAAAAETAVYLLLRNQYTLLRLVNRRSDDTLPIPAEIRRTNLQLLLLLSGSAAILFLFSKPLAALLGILGNTAKWLLRVFLQGITHLLDTLSGGQPVESVPVPDAGTLPPPNNTDANPLWNLLWLLLIPPVLWIWKTLLSDWFYDIRLRLTSFHLRRQTHNGEPEIHSAESGEYTDIETICTPIEDAPQKAVQRLWKKRYRKWKASASSLDKFNEGYRLMLTAPAWKQQPHRSDTPLEILAFSKIQMPVTAQQPLAQITDAFAQIRYAEQPMPLEALTAMEQTLQQLSVPCKEHASAPQSSSLQKGAL